MHAWAANQLQRLEGLRGMYASAEPFPHVVIDDFLPKDLALACAAAFPNPADEQWINYSHVNSSKWGLTDLEAIPNPLQDVIRLLNAGQFRDGLTAMTRIQHLLDDPALSGGGLHVTSPGGFLNVHTDFTAHPSNRNWRRRINLLLYLTEGWNDEWGGALELWNADVSECAQRLAPRFNRCVIFETDEKSFHGVPDPLRSPAGTNRCSIALYYFTDEGRPVKPRATNYRPRASDGQRRWLIRADNAVLGAYSRVRHRFGIDDRSVGRFLGRLRRR
jgi:hypothetical protein